MKRKGEILFPILLLGSDILGMALAFYGSYWLRFDSPLVRIFPVIKGVPDARFYVKASLFVIPLWIVILGAMRLYRSSGMSVLDEIFGVFKATTVGSLSVMSAAFLYRGFSYSRLTFIYMWILSAALLVAGRLALRLYINRLRKKGWNVKRCAVVGPGEFSERVVEEIRQGGDMDYNLVGTIGFESPKGERIGEVDKIREIVKEQGLDLLILTIPPSERKKIAKIISDCEGLDVEFYLVPDLYDLLAVKVSMGNIGGVPVMGLKGRPLSGWNAVVKRGMDIAVSGVLLMALWPLFLPLALIIKGISKGPIFYRQERIGRDGRRFVIFKFRSMMEDAEGETGPVWAAEDDPRVTPVGRFLRRWSIDELPQLWNVLKGEMSLVGPRPEREYFVDQFGSEVPQYLDRHRVKSGMSGWAQVNGLRGNAPIEERTKYDIYYIENWSIGLDIKILLMTLFGRKTERGAY